ncbi:SH3 domain-containing protein [Tabrizicola oligotrophica]|uniref:SH3 domain-containing protein n=1 Tax=Tabrizicola oligotrophica TaxID=2710650 RepID=A0A6M0QQ76_9RHOB|nr:SH3 domain-containing protein [Tabrizicola oligotrophica]NEY89635.1 SH3 domain-containing protein [Tabrizicola oligotrophica]
MFRLTALLCAAIYAAFLIGGQDRGQLRFGLMQASTERLAAEAAITAAPSQAAEPQVRETSFAPEKPLMSGPAAALPATPESAPQTPPEGQIFYVNAASVNVREGPGKDHAVIDRLPRGEAVLVLVPADSPDGWSLIRIEGDGLQGYVAARLLTE